MLKIEGKREPAMPLYDKFKWKRHFNVVYAVGNDEINKKQRRNLFWGSLILISISLFILTSLTTIENSPQLEITSPAPTIWPKWVEVKLISEVNSTAWVGLFCGEFVNWVWWKPAEHYQSTSFWGWPSTLSTGVNSMKKLLIPILIILFILSSITAKRIQRDRKLTSVWNHPIRIHHFGEYRSLRYILSRWIRVTLISKVDLTVLWWNHMSNVEKFLYIGCES